MLLKVTFTVPATHPCEAKQKAKQRLHRWMMQYPVEMYLTSCEVKRIDKALMRVDLFVSVDSWEYEDDRVVVIK